MIVADCITGGDKHFIWLGRGAVLLIEVMLLVYYQGRVWADSPDDASMIVWGMYPTAMHVSIRETHIKRWYEYGVIAYAEQEQDTM